MLRHYNAIMAILQLPFPHYILPCPIESAFGT
jgi:hypothetical protein